MSFAFCATSERILSDEKPCSRDRYGARVTPKSTGDPQKPLTTTAPARRVGRSLLGHDGLLLEEPESLPDAI